MHDTHSPWPRRVSFVLAAALAFSIAHSVYRIPIQVSDSLDAILLGRRAPSTLDLMADTSQSSSTTLRPFRYVQARWLSLAAENLRVSQHAIFRGVHAFLAVALVGLLAWVADPKRWIDATALGVAMTVLIGLHSFTAMMRESFPVNHYAEVSVACLFVIGVALRPPTLIRQLLVILFLAAGLLLIESALLLWLVIVGGAVVGLPGIQRPTALAATVLLLAVLVTRVSLDIGSPGIGSHSIGWWDVVLSGDEARERFASNPWPLYAYNVVGGASSILLSEPRFGVFQVLYARSRESLSPVVIINIASSLAVTGLLAACCWSLLRRPRRDWSSDQRVLAVGLAVITVSAVLCANYIKDDIIGTAGVFYALAAFVATRWLLDRQTSSALRPVSLATVVLVVASALWAFRSVGTHYELARTAFTTRNDWALRSQQTLAGGDRAAAADLALTGRIRNEALARPVTSPSFLPDWGERYWIE